MGPPGLLPELQSSSRLYSPGGLDEHWIWGTGLHSIPSGCLKLPQPHMEAEPCREGCLLFGQGSPRAPSKV